MAKQTVEVLNKIMLITFMVDCCIGLFIYIFIYLCFHLSILPSIERISRKLATLALAYLQ